MNNKQIVQRVSDKLNELLQFSTGKSSTAYFKLKLFSTDSMTFSRRSFFALKKYFNYATEDELAEALVSNNVIMNYCDDIKDFVFFKSKTHYIKNGYLYKGCPSEHNIKQDLNNKELPYTYTQLSNLLSKYVSNTQENPDN